MSRTFLSRYMSSGGPAAPRRNTDEHLIRETREAIQKERSLAGALGIAVNARNGVVVLNGTAGSEAERMSIGDKAAAVAGFGKVKNDIQVPGIRQEGI